MRGGMITWLVHDFLGDVRGTNDRISKRSAYAFGIVLA